MAWSVPLSLANPAATSGSGTATTGSNDTTTANFLAVVVGARAGEVLTISDSKSNSWAFLTLHNSAGDFGSGQLWFAPPPITVGTGHTFTVSGASNVCVIGVCAFSGSASSPFDVENGSGTIVSSNQIITGSITPNFNNELILSGGVGYGATSIVESSGGGFTTFVDNSAGNAELSVAIAYVIQTSAASQNSLWVFNTLGQVRPQAAVIASFKASAAGVTNPSRLSLLGVG